ncbi:hypothetical protein [Chitinophaga sp. CF418]|uniref:hypothetical protein n=1 Tax=Chitinophaga sp. CF418 TaxID=1855287 RepID=UPI000920D694|nr:hypothetical protein [Chitinophaga sp. CF418]SHN29611.1 hypothetical protein SAMN05216311_108227 [Chitinophaga sp. CF418]
MKYLVLVLVSFILKIEKGAAQDCRVHVDSSGLRISYLDTDYITKDNNFFIMLAGVSGGVSSFFKLFKDTTDYYIEYGIKGGGAKSYKVKTTMPMLDTFQVYDRDYYIISSKQTRHYFDMLIIKKGEHYSQIIPHGSTVFNSRDCIIDCDKNIVFLFLEFEQLYNKHYKLKRRK